MPAPMLRAPQLIWTAVPVPWSEVGRQEGGGTRRAASLFTVVNSDGDDGIGNEGAVAAVLIESFQTARHHLHGSMAVGERSSDLGGAHLLRVRPAEQHMTGHILSGGTPQSAEPETAMMNGVKDGALRRQRVIQAVDIHAHPHFRYAANQRHGALSCLRSGCCRGDVLRGRPCLHFTVIYGKGPP